MFEMTWKGRGVMEKNIRAVAKDFPKKVYQAVKAEGELEMTESKKRCPVDTGRLHASGRVDVEQEGNRTWAVMSYGIGPSSEYAWIVHEDPDAIHPVGEWKYLESVMDESRPYAAERIGRRLHLDGPK